MARIENHPRVILTQEERETLRQTKKIMVELDTSDSNNDIFCACDNYSSEWEWIEDFIEKLVNMSEVEE